MCCHLLHWRCNASLVSLQQLTHYCWHYRHDRVSLSVWWLSLCLVRRWHCGLRKKHLRPKQYPESKARRTYSRLGLFTTRLKCREQIGLRQFNVNCADWATYTVTTTSRPIATLSSQPQCVFYRWYNYYMHHGAIWCLDTHQELHRLWLADTLRRSPPDSPGESAEIWADWDEIQSLVTRDLVSGRADRKSGQNRGKIVSMYAGLYMHSLEIMSNPMGKENGSVFYNPWEKTLTEREREIDGDGYT